MKHLSGEIHLFQSQPRDMRLLILTNLLYAFVLPVVEIFVNAYIMRHSHEVRLVMAYQLSVYVAIPLTFLLNGVLLKHFPIRRLYSVGMLLSGVSMGVMIVLPAMDAAKIAAAGILMGISFGLYWANRDYLALSTTGDANRNYYYGVESFLYTLVALVVPASVGWFIECSAAVPWLGSQAAYLTVMAVVFVITVAASVVIHRGCYANPPASRFVYVRFHPIWMRFQVMSVLRGLAQGYIITAPSMLVMQLLGGEAALGTSLSIGAVFSALALYLIGRFTAPRHRLAVLGVGLLLFVLGGVCNAVLFNAVGVSLFLLCLLLARPLLDVAYFPIQLFVIDTLAELERRNRFAYILHQEFALFVGRAIGCGVFLLLAFTVSNVVALRYAILIIGVVQLFSVVIGRATLRECAALATR